MKTKTVSDVVNEFHPHWDRVKKTINQYPGAFVMCYNEQRGYYLEVSLEEIERGIQNQQAKDNLLKQAAERYERLRTQRNLLQGNYTQETIQEIAAKIESYQASLTAKKIALNSLTSKIQECKELARIVYGKDIKVDIVFNHE